MTVKQLKEALNDYPDNAKVLIFESENWQDSVDDYRLKNEYLYTDGEVNKMFIIIP